MRVDILTLFPNMMNMFFEESIVRRARDKGIVDVHFHDLHDYSMTRYGSVDDYPYGGGAGMVMAVEHRRSLSSSMFIIPFTLSAYIQCPLPR